MLIKIIKKQTKVLIRLTVTENRRSFTSAQKMVKKQLKLLH